jgi:hypothetical protein
LKDLNGMVNILPSVNSIACARLAFPMLGKHFVKMSGQFDLIGLGITGLFRASNMA